MNTHKIKWIHTHKIWWTHTHKIKWTHTQNLMNTHMQTKLMRGLVSSRKTYKLNSNPKKLAKTIEVSSGSEGVRRSEASTVGGLSAWFSGNKQVEIFIFRKQTCGLSPSSEVRVSFWCRSEGFWWRCNSRVLEGERESRRGEGFQKARVRVSDGDGQP